jgi:hypothetical protein
MDELTRQELLALIGEQQVVIAQLNKTIQRIRKEASGKETHPTPPE